MSLKQLPCDFCELLGHFVVKPPVRGPVFKLVFPINGKSSWFPETGQNR